MKRFNHEDEDDESKDNFYFKADDDDDDDDEDEDNFENLDEEDDEIDTTEYELELAQVNSAREDLNQRLLFRVMKMLEQGWFWKFKSNENKLKIIKHYYNYFKKMTKIED